jgi:cytidylate kinase
VSGPHGTGKSTYARALAKALGLRYVSAGELFRELAKKKGMSLRALGSLAAQNATIDRMIDEQTKAEANAGGVVIDAQLGAWMARDLPTVKLLLTAPDEVRFKRIAERDKSSFHTAREETISREQIQKERYKKYYGIDVEDVSIYDLKIDTSQHSIEETSVLIISEVRRLLAQKG